MIEIQKLQLKMTLKQNPNSILIEVNEFTNNNNIRVIKNQKK